MAYKVRSKGCFDSGGVKYPLHRVLTLIGNGDTSDGVRPKKNTPTGPQ